jgi:hypothetical protein
MNMFRLVWVLLAASAAFSPGVFGAEKSLVDAGVPALGRVWFGDDYLRAAEVIESGKVPLPVLSSAEGRKFFQRATSLDNLAPYQKPILPIQQRLATFGVFLRGTVALLPPYLAAAGRGANVHSELIQLQAFMLRAGAVGIQLSDEAMTSTRPDQRNPQFAKGLEQMRSGIATMFAGAEKSLSETRFYSAEDISVLLTAMAETMPRVSKAFSAEFRSELCQRLEERRAESPDASDAKSIQAMLDVLGKPAAEKESL